MKLRGYLAVAIVALAGSFSGTAQESPKAVKPLTGCMSLKEGVAGISDTADLTFVPIRSMTGDLNMDGREEEIVLVRHVGKSSPRPDEVLVYEVEGESVKLLTRQPIARAGEYVLSINSFGSNFKVENGLLFVDVAVPSDEKTAPPKHFRTVAYGWDGKGLVESSRSEAKPLPEHMREMG